MCTLLGVSRRKYYAWIKRDREPTYAALDRRLLVLIRSLHRVRRLMRLAGLMGIFKKRRQAPRSAHTRFATTRFFGHRTESGLGHRHHGTGDRRR